MQGWDAKPGSKKVTFLRHVTQCSGKSAMFPRSFSMTTHKKHVLFCKGMHRVWPGRCLGARVGSQVCLILKPISLVLSSLVDDEDRKGKHCS